MTTTMGQLMTFTRMRCGIEQDNSIQDSELMMMLNMALGNLDEVLVNEYEEYNLTSYIVTLPQPATGAPNVAPLPSDFHKLRAVDYGWPGSWITLYPFQMPERNRFNNPVANLSFPYGTQVSRKFRLEGNQLYIMPVSFSSGQYQVWYTPKYTFITDVNQTIPIYMDTQGWLQYAISNAGIQVYTKLLLDPTQFKDQMNYFEEIVRNGCVNRMSTGPKCVVNVRNINDACDPWGSGGGWSGIGG